MNANSSHSSMNLSTDQNEVESTSSSRAPSFFDVLKEQIKSDLRSDLYTELRREIENELRGSDQISCPQMGTTNPLAESSSRVERLEVWLATHLQRPQVSSGQSQKLHHPYSANSTTAQKAVPKNTQPQIPQQILQLPASEEQRHARSPQQLSAIETLRSFGAQIDTTFTLSELKTAWRKTALRTHPDRFAGQDALTVARMSLAFRKIADAVEILNQAFSSRI